MSSRKPVSLTARLVIHPNIEVLVQLGRGSRARFWCHITGTLRTTGHGCGAKVQAPFKPQGTAVVPHHRHASDRTLLPPPRRPCCAESMCFVCVRMPCWGQLACTKWWGAGGVGQAAWVACGVQRTAQCTPGKGKLRAAQCTPGKGKTRAAHCTLVRSLDAHLFHRAPNLCTSSAAHCMLACSTEAHHRANLCTSRAALCMPACSTEAHHAANLCATRAALCMLVRSTGAHHAANLRTSRAALCMPVRSTGAHHAANLRTSRAALCMPVRSTEAHHAAIQDATRDALCMPVRSTGAHHAAIQDATRAALGVLCPVVVPSLLLVSMVGAHGACMALTLEPKLNSRA